MENDDMINAVLGRDKESFAAAFAAAMANKVSDALDIKKVEVASSLLSTEVETNEPTETETQVSGDGDGTVDTDSDAV